MPIDYTHQHVSSSILKVDDPYVPIDPNGGGAVSVTDGTTTVAAATGFVFPPGSVTNEGAGVAGVAAGVNGMFVQMYSSGISGDLAVWDFFADEAGNTLDGIPAGMGLAFNANEGGSTCIDATEAGIWMLSAYANPNFDATAHVTMYLGSHYTPSGGVKAQMPDIAQASWGTEAVLELCLADIVKTTGAVVSVALGLIYLSLLADSPTGTPWSGGATGSGLTIVRLA